MKFNKYALLIALLCIPMATTPMGARFFKPAFYKLCRGTNLALTFAPSFATIYYKSQRETKNEGPGVTAPLIVKDFVNMQAQMVGHNKPITVRYEGGASAEIGGEALDNTIIIQSPHSELEQSLNIRIDSRHYPAAQKKINQYKFICQHEANHLKNNDRAWKESLKLIAPFIIHGSFNRLRFLAQACKLIGSKNPAPGVLKSLSEIPAGFGKLVIASGMLSSHSKHTEQRADDQVVNSKDVLEGGVSVLKVYNESAPFFNSSHPSPETRIAKLEQRLEKLKEQEAKK